MEYYEIIKNFIFTQLETNQFFSGAALVTFGGGLLWKLQIPLIYLWNRIIRLIHFKVTVEESFVYNHLYNWTNEYFYINNNKNFRNTLARITTFHLDDVDDEESTSPSYNRMSSSTQNILENDTKINNNEVKYEQNIDSYVYWYKRFPIFVTKNRKELQNPSNSNLKSMYFDSFTLVSFFNKKILKTLLNDIRDYGFTKEKKYLESKEVKVFLNTNEYWTEMQSIKPKSFENIFFEGKKELIDDIEHWIKSKEKYDRLGVTHKRGFLFWGKPGNGKSTAAMAVAKYLLKNIYYFDLGKVTDASDLSYLFTSIPKNSVLLIEDIDAYISDDDTREFKNGILNFSSFINTVSGVLEKEGVILIVTTNKKDKLDDALIRSGRLDKHIYFDDPSVNQITEFLNHVYKSNIKLDFTPNINFSDLQNLILKDDSDDVNNIIKKLKEYTP